MSGGAYEYQYHTLNNLADEIEQDFINDGKYETQHYPDKEVVEEDRLSDATEEERPLILNEIRSLVDDLRKCAVRAKELEWYMSGDTGATSYLKRLREYYDTGDTRK